MTTSWGIFQGHLQVSLIHAFFSQKAEVSSVFRQGMYIYIYEYFSNNVNLIGSQAIEVKLSTHITVPRPLMNPQFPMISCCMDSS